MKLRSPKGRAVFSTRAPLAAEGWVLPLQAREKEASSATMLSQTNMLVPEGEGRRQRSRGTCYVDTPPFGFFVAGSSAKAMNGVYVRRRGAPAAAERAGEDILLYYAHTSGLWTMVLAEVRAAGDDDESDGYRWRPEPVRSWLLIDERKVDRFAHVGDTIVPGAGVRWKHVHTQSGTAGAGLSARYQGPRGAEHALARAHPDDDEQLPWQVIAILDQGILQDLIAGARYHQHRIDEALAGRGDAVVAPALTSLEGIFEPHRWMYVVEAAEVAVREAPAETARTVGTRVRGEYVRGLEVRQTASGGQWLRLEDPASPVALDELGEGGASSYDHGDDARDDDDDEEEEGEEEEEEEENDDSYLGVLGLTRQFLGRRARKPERGHYNSQLRWRKREWWLKLADGADRPVRKVEAADCAHMSGERIEGEEALALRIAQDDEKATEPREADPPKGRLDSSLAGEFLDAPFVPQLEAAADVLADVSASSGEAAAEAGASGAAVQRDEATALGGAEEAAIIAATALQSCAFPIGAAVVIVELSARGSAQFNGTEGTVLTPASADGRQGVRLGPPFSGKKVSPRIANLVLAPARARAEPSPAGEREELGRYARLLGLTLHELGLALAREPDGEAGERPVFGDGFRAGDVTPHEALELSLIHI